MALDMPTVISLVGPDAQALVPDEQGRVDDDESYDARRKEHQTENIHG
jgi:hypothetical protein